MGEDKSIKQMLVDELKKEGLDIAEEAAVAAARAIIRVLPMIALKTENKIDDMFVPVLTIMEPKIMEMLDKIDGEDDPGR